MSRDIIPPVLVPYIRRDGTGESSLSLVTSTLTNPPHWLLLRHLYAGLTSSPPNATSSTNTVVLVSLLQSRDCWLELCKKTGVDLVSLTKSKQLVYIDGVDLDSNPSEISKSIFPVIKFTSLDLDDLLRIITTTISSITHTKSHTTLIIDGIDFLLALQPDTITTAQQTLSTLFHLATHTIVTLHADGPFLHNHSSTISTPLEKAQASLLTTLAHQATYVFQLRGLSTGAAKGITGVLRVTRGGGFDDDSEEGGSAEGVDGEWLYQWKGDGGVHLWVRGE
ncbi:uncharacterized protein AB675_5758 [Cyphellophora attinorum]|uniref:Elongator complex protein 6 n=1 Tax=Cyphellophora attinorum TaxID=1664694 RepID=A0A0N0NL59_9EURO|nr:uncharacterized protein AB675_5758 [Phialophora attinorum]KPI38921.1 hypothetical protein AB675_5758 [Phialophora attinorum]